jgi:hypothetical protein
VPVSTRWPTFPEREERLCFLSSSMQARVLRDPFSLGHAFFPLQGPRRAHEPLLLPFNPHLRSPPANPSFSPRRRHHSPPGPFVLLCKFSSKKTAPKTTVAMAADAPSLE